MMHHKRLVAKIARCLRISVDQYWSLKISAPPDYDVVLAGNSRIFKGLSPRHMAHVLKGRRIFNLGFSSCMLDSRYLEHARSLLRDDSSPKILVLGITPHVLIRRPANRCWYDEWADKLPIDRDELWREIILQHLNGAVVKRTMGTAYRHFSRGILRQRHYADGWVSTRVAQLDPMDYVQRMNSVYSRYQVDPSLMDEMLKKVAKFTSQGVVVYGLSPPTFSAMRNLEKLASGLDRDALLQGFAKAGGVWLEMPTSGYCAYNGTHLDGVQAKRFSRQVAFTIKAHQENLP